MPDLLTTSFGPVDSPRGAFLSHPIGVVVGSTGDVYVGDVSNHRVVRLSADDRHLSSSYSVMGIPAGLALDASGTCQVPTGVSASDIWDLRRPGSAISEGNVVAVATSSHKGPKCGEITVKFRVSPRLGFFVVFNENASVHWGPFDSAALPADAWRVHLSFNPS